MESIENNTNYLETGVIINKDDGSVEVYQIPYNINNTLIKDEDIINIFNRYNVKIDKINNLEFFHTALTHKSYVKKDVFKDYILEASKKEMGEKNIKNLLELRNESYERLEYFGDRVVKIVVSLYLFYRYPKEDEGFMTRLQTKIEDKKNLSYFSKELGLGQFFIISKQIESLNGRNLEKIHEDVFEAFMGALFLSNGFEPCCLLLINLLETLVDYSDKLYCDNNYKDNLLRFHHKKKWKFPIYHTVHMEGPPHKRIYTMGVENNNITDDERKDFLNKKNYEKLCISFGKGNSKKEGEQKSAKMALILHGNLNKDQFDMNDDIYYPNFSELFKDNNRSSTNSILNNNEKSSESEDSEETDSDY